MGSKRLLSVLGYLFIFQLFLAYLCCFYFTLLRLSPLSSSHFYCFFSLLLFHSSLTHMCSKNFIASLSLNTFHLFAYLCLPTQIFSQRAPLRVEIYPGYKTIPTVLPPVFFPLWTCFLHPLPTDIAPYFYHFPQPCRSQTNCS